MNERRIKILVLFSEGYVPKEIAAKLELGTLNNEVARIKQELGAKTIAQSVRKGIEKGYILLKSSEAIEHNS